MKKNVVILSLAAVCMLVCAIAIAQEKEIKLAAMPAAVDSAVKALFPQAQVKEIEKEKEGVQVYEIELMNQGTKSSVVVAEDGTVAEVETVVAADALPKAVVDALGDAKITKAEKEVVQAKPQMVKLASPETVYEVKVNKDGKEVEMTFDASGKKLGEEVKQEEDKD